MISSKMAIITLQFGQCGNEIGQSLYSYIYKDIKFDTHNLSFQSNEEYVKEALNKWFSINKQGNWEARSVLVDTENKVILSRKKYNEFKFKNIVAKSHGGSANNWACGYTYKSKLLVGDVMEAVRKEAERCDELSSILSILSSAGGTGSGCGSKVIECLRSEYPAKMMNNVIVLPYESGEVVTQSYNSLLTLSKLYSVTDAIFLFENDKTYHICNKLMSMKEVNFCDLNSVITQQLACLFQPVTGFSFLRDITSLVAHPSFKFIQIKSAPHIVKEHMKYEVPGRWSVLINNARFSLRKSDMDFDFITTKKMQKKSKHIGNILITRGGVVSKVDNMNFFMDPKLYVNWIPGQEKFKHCHQFRKFRDTEHFLAILTNNNNICPSLNTILHDAWTLYMHGAYLHHYDKFGIDADCFSTSFEIFRWSLQEKKLLLAALRKHGANDLSVITEEIPFKSVTEVRFAVKKYERLAAETMKNKCQTQSKCEAPIDKWLKLTKLMSPHPLYVMHLSKALKYISLFEKRSEDIDISLRACYDVLSNLVTGAAPKAINTETAYFLNKCLINLARTLKKENNEKEKNFLENTPWENFVPKNTYGKKNQRVIQAFKDSSVNPLHVPNELLIINRNCN